MTDYSGFFIQGLSTGLGSGFNLGASIQELKWKKQEKEKLKKAQDNLQAAIQSAFSNPENKSYMDDVFSSNSWANFKKADTSLNIPSMGTVGTQGAAALPSMGTVGTQGVATTPQAMANVGQAQTQQPLGGAGQRGIGSEGFLASEEAWNLMATFFAFSESAGEASKELLLAIDAGDRQAAKQWSDYLTLLTETAANVNLKGIAHNVEGLKQFITPEGMKYLQAAETYKNTAAANQTFAQTNEMWQLSGGQPLLEPSTTKTATIGETVDVLGTVISNAGGMSEEAYNQQIEHFKGLGVDLSWLSHEEAKGLWETDQIDQYLAYLAAGATKEQAQAKFFGKEIGATGAGAAGAEEVGSYATPQETTQAAAVFEKDWTPSIHQSASGRWTFSLTPKDPSKAFDLASDIVYGDRDLITGARKGGVVSLTQNITLSSFGPKGFTDKDRSEIWNNWLWLKPRFDARTQDMVESILGSIGISAATVGTVGGGSGSVGGDGALDEKMQLFEKEHGFGF